MDFQKLLRLKKHPDYESTIKDLLHNKVDKEVMQEAIKCSKDGAQAEAIYVKLKLEEREL